MPTKAVKSVKKVSAKKVKTSTKKAVRARVTTAEHPITEVFTTRPVEETTIEVPNGSVAVFVNGRSQGNVHSEGQKLGDFAVGVAQRAGITSFSIYADGVKMTSKDKDKSLAQITKIEIVAKDSRG